MGLVEGSVRTLKDILHKNENLSQLMLDEQIFAVNSKDDGITGSNNTRFYGRGIRSGLPNSFERFVDWQQDIKRRGEIKEQRYLRKERTVGKHTYEIGETVRLQNIKTKKWDTFGVVKGIRTADDDTILSYDIDIDGMITSRHRKYMSKIRNSDEVTEEENRAGASRTTDDAAQ